LIFVAVAVGCCQKRDFAVTVVVVQLFLRVLRACFFKIEQTIQSNESHRWKKFSIKMSDFKQGLCGCFDSFGICACTYFCPCYITGKTAEGLGKSCCIWGFLSLTPLRPITGAMLRQSVREKYGIDGSLIGDCCFHWFCSCCATIQEASEVVERGDAPDAMCMGREWRRRKWLEKEDEDKRSELEFGTKHHKHYIYDYMIPTTLLKFWLIYQPTRSISTIKLIMTEWTWFYYSLLLLDNFSQACFVSSIYFIIYLGMFFNDKPSSKFGWIFLRYLLRSN